LIFTSDKTVIGLDCYLEVGLYPGTVGPPFLSGSSGDREGTIRAIFKLIIVEKTYMIEG
jgi:hypothetical protein